MGKYLLGIYLYLVILFLIFLIPFLIAGIALLVNGLKEFKVPNQRKTKAIIMTAIGGTLLTIVLIGTIVSLDSFFSTARDLSNSSSNGCFNCPPSNEPQSSELMSYLTCLYYYL